MAAVVTESVGARKKNPFNYAKAMNWVKFTLAEMGTRESILQ